MNAIANSANVIFWGVITFSILVVLHEGGHFLAARAFGVKVHEFMIGLPGPAIRLRTKSTTFGITAIPLGGYVRIAGMEPGPEDPLMGAALGAVTRARRANAFQVAEALGIDEEHAERLLVSLSDWGAIEADPASDDAYLALADVSLAEDEQALVDSARSVTYRGQPTWRRILILAMGVVVNLVTAILIFTVVLSFFGYYQQSLVVDKVLAGGAAKSAGLLSGDKITAVGDVGVKDWKAFTDEIAKHDPGATVVIGFARDGEQKSVDAVLKARPDGGGAFLGVQSSVEHVRPGPVQSLAESFKWTGMVFVAIGDLFRPSTFKQSIQGARSVVGISVEVARAVHNGPIDFAWMVALLSLSLGVMNLLPIPPLDGGKIVIELVEKAMHRPLSRRLSLSLSAAGALLLFSLIGYLVYADVARLVANG
jgi:regulator of sigma E protease